MYTGTSTTCYFNARSLKKCISIYFCNKSIYVAGFLLSESVNTEHGLSVVRGVPTRIKNDNSVSADQVHPKAPGFGRDKEQSRSEKLLIMESICRMFSVKGIFQCKASTFFSLKYVHFQCSYPH